MTSPIPEHLLKKADVGAIKRLMDAKLNPGQRDPEGEFEGLVEHPGDLGGLHASMHIIAKDCMEVLTRRYPGFMWGVQPSAKGGVINIFCLNFSKMWGYTIRIDDIHNDPDRKEAVRAGGELLRRFRYTADRFIPELVAALPRNAQGEVIPDITDMKKGKHRTAAEIELAMAEGRARHYRGANGEHLVEVSR